jgi:type II secretory pathway pseudopilin PulG
MAWRDVLSLFNRKPGMTDVATTGPESLAYAVPARRRRSGFGLLGWTVGIVVIIGMLIAVLLPSLCKSSETANKAKCALNLHQIGLAIALYAKDHGGQYPPSLAVLVEQEKLSSAVFVCPSSNQEPAAATDTAGVAAELATAEKGEVGHRKCLSYVYVGKGLNTATVAATAIVAYEPLENHDGDGTNVLFGDEHTEWVNKKAWPSVAAAAGLPVVGSPAAGVAAVPSPTTRP